MSAPNLVVASTLAMDRLLDQRGQLIREQPGGPFMFIQQVLKQENIPFINLTPSEPAVVDIRLQDGEEVGSVTYVPFFTIDWKTISAPNILVSTILDETSLDGIEGFSGKLFVDAQGFVRTAKKQGFKWNLADALQRRIFCLKATEEECRFIEPAFIEEQKTRLLLMTRGAKGVICWAFGEQFEVSPKETIHSSDTIGAGDTFFAYVVAGISKNQLGVVEIVREAVRKISDFLISKTHHITPL